METQEPKIEIEKGVSIPLKKRGRPQKYPFEEMEICDSFFVECKDDEYEKCERKLLSSSGMYGSKTSKKFTVRAVPGGVRCWRIA